MEQNTSVANFFKEAFDIDWEKMNIGDPIDVSHYNKFVKSFNIDTQKNEFNLVTRIIRKPNSSEYKVTVGDKSFSCSSDHKIACKFRQDKKDFTYLPVSTLFGKKVLGLTESQDWEYIQIEKTGKEIPILDFEVDKTHNYYSDDILSHNTIFGNPEVTPGGKALKFWSSIRLDVRRVEYINEGKDNVIGVKTRIKSSKNKTAPPFRKVEVDVIFGKGIQYEAEYVDFAAKYGIIEKSASWFDLYDTEGNFLIKLQGKDSVIEYFKSNPNYFQFIQEKTNNAILNENSGQNNEEEENDGTEIETIENDSN